MDQRLFTVDEAAEFLQIHPKTLRRKIREGAIESTRVGKRYRFTRAQLQAFLGEDVALPELTPTSVQRRSVASTVIDATAVPPAVGERVGNYLMAALNNARQLRSGQSIKTSVHCQYFAETGELKIMLSGEVATVQTLMGIAQRLLETDSATS